MTIDWQAFTPLTAAIGGALIGCAVAMLLLLNGRVAGVSGIVGGLLRPTRGDIAWRAAFVAGLLLAPAVFMPLWASAIVVDAGYGTLALAGLLVGFGSRLGSGCTSGHGICGISRLSPRSLVATVVFMAAGVVTVFLVRHVIAG